MVTAMETAHRPGNAVGASECPRCRGLMVAEWSPELETMAWRCVQCGELIDAVILSNRRAGAHDAHNLAVSMNVSEGKD
jgi:hypothetical protein